MTALNSINATLKNGRHFMKRMTTAALIFISVAVFLVAGCGKQAQDTRASAKVVPAAQSASTKISGSPAFTELAVPPKPELTAELVARGKTLYVQNCVACHGINGDGKGDAAAFLAPKPRDFVKANYRLRSTGPNSLPTDVDLFREISLGVPGTPMPPWKHMLNDGDRWALVEYLKSLSPRFADKTEARVAISDFGAPPVKTPEAIRQGRELYTKFTCITCHGESGRGDGVSALTLVDDSGGKIKPRDFANPNAFKGGYATKEIVRTILTGLNGTPMMGLADAISKEEAWKLAYYVETFVKPGVAGPINPASQNFLSREDLGAPDVKINLTERAWKYDPEVIRVKKGQIIEIRFEPTDNGLGVGHGLGISGYDENVFINGAMVGAPKSAKFRADRAGTFTFYCSTQCSTEKLHPLMHGTLIVEEDKRKQTASVE
jgi:mono/diheme cytochrome c family protein